MSALAVTAAVVIGLPAAPAPVKWLPPPQQVPKARTTMSPALTVLTPPGGKTETALFWAGPRAASSADYVSYQISENLRHDPWSAPVLVPGALTGDRPSAAQFGGPAAHQAIVTWSGAPDHKVWYSVGTISKAGALSWPRPAAVIPGAFTSTGPSVFAALFSGALFVTWEANSSHQVDYAIGKITGASVTWSPVGHLPAAQAGSAPAVAEASTSHSAGRLFVFWQSASGGRRIEGAWTADPPSARSAWTPVHPAPSVATGAAPAAVAIGKAGGFPLLLAYRAVGGTQLRYALVDAAGSVSTSHGWTVPGLKSSLGPALTDSILAANDPGEIGYLPYVRVCAGC